MYSNKYILNAIKTIKSQFKRSHLKQPILSYNDKIEVVLIKYVLDFNYLTSMALSLLLS